MPYFPATPVELADPINWWAQLAQIERSATDEQAILAVIGDSWVRNTYITVPITEWLEYVYGDAGDGYVGIGMSHGAPTTNVTYARVGTWIDRDNGASPVARGVDIADATSTDTSTPAKVTIVGTNNAFVIHYIKQPSGGSFRWRIDAGSWTTVATANATEIYATETISGLSTASHTLEIEVSVAGSSGVTLLGVDCQRTGNGVRVHRLGNGGATAAQYIAADATLWQDGLIALAPTSVVLLLGTNDQAFNVAPATFGASIDTIVGRISAALPLADVILLSPADNGLTGKTYMVTQFRDELKAAARRNNCVFIDTYTPIGSYANGNSRGLYENTSHLNEIGGQVVADAILRRLRGV